VPAAENLDPLLARALEKLPNVVDRQLHLLSWFFGRFAQHLPASNLIRYEDVVATKGKCLRNVTSRANDLHEPLESRNKNKLYDHARMRELGQRLLDTDGAYWKFYSRESVKELVDAAA
jgi:hypothetical protein